jgi:D-sedoheptulose 7-phosphate isomerase
MTEHVAQFFKAVGRISSEIDATVIDRLAHELGALRERRGRLFLLGVGGSAGNCGRLLRGFG